MKYYCIKQHDVTDCGAACLATISKQYGLNISISKIREIAGTDKRGTNVYGMIEAAEKLGFSAKGVKGSKEAIFTEYPLPAIAHIVSRSGLYHYVVVHKVTSKKIIVADPDEGIVKYDPQEFMKLWTGVMIILAPSAEFKKADERCGVVSRFFKMMLPQKKLIFSIFFASLLITGMGILSSFYFKIIMDEIVPNSLTGTLVTVSIGILVLYLLKALLEAFRNQLMLHMGQKIDIPLILGYYRHVLGLPMKFFDSRRVGEIVSRFMDASKIRDAVSNATLTLMIDTLMTAAGAVVLYNQSSSLFMIAVIVAVIYAVIVFAFNKPIKNSNEKQMEDNSQLTSYLVESLNGIETVKSFGADDKVQAKADRLFVRLLKSAFRCGTITNAEKTLSGAVSTIGTAVILWVGVCSVLKGNMTLGALISFNALLQYFLEPLKNIINLQPNMQTAIVAADRLSEILDLELEKDLEEGEKIEAETLLEPIKIENLDFRYGTRELVLRDINMEIKPGEKIALVGESGSGKTTLAKMLINFYSWEKGDIYIGSNNIKDISLDSLRRKISYISQDIFLFSGTIKENLLLGNEDATMDDIVKACELSRADDFINRLPLRYDTRIEENGANLSGGQRQRLAIARALIKNPDILIMDEATSNLDSVTEKGIEKTIEHVSENMTTIIIAHRLSTIMNCDRIFVMEAGRIVEAGTHQELLEKGGKYSNFWKEQLPDEVKEITEFKKVG